jgi:hypothetical protein
MRFGNVIDRKFEFDFAEARQQNSRSQSWIRVVKAVPSFRRR